MRITLPAPRSFAPACPRCGDLLPPGALVCPCGCRTMLKSLDPKRPTRKNPRMVKP